MDDDRTQPLIEVFPLPPWVDPADAPGLVPGSGDSCGPGCGCGPTRAPDLAVELARFGERHGDAIELRVIGYEGDELLASAVARLDAIFRGSGQPMRVTRDNLDELMRTLGPFVAIDGRLIHAGLVPTEAQLTFMLEARRSAGAGFAPG